jgi:hypothetical protein
MNQFQGQGRGTGRPHFLLGTVMVGIVLSVFLEVTVQLLPPHYNPLSQSESDLAIGPHGWLMALNFLLRGVLYLIFVVTFLRIIPKEGQSCVGLILLGISAIEKLIIAFAATDLSERPQTIHGTIHALAALTSFFCGALGILMISRSLSHISTLRPSLHFLLALASATLVWSVIVILTVFVSTQIEVWGLLERILTALFSLWIVAASLGLWHASSPGGNAREQTTFSHS